MKKNKIHNVYTCEQFQSLHKILYYDLIVIQICNMFYGHKRYYHLCIKVVVYKLNISLCRHISNF
jgi:hypothetical protein